MVDSTLVVSFRVPFFFFHFCPVSLRFHRLFSLVSIQILAILFTIAYSSVVFYTFYLVLGFLSFVSPVPYISSSLSTLVPFFSPLGLEFYACRVPLAYFLHLSFSNFSLPFVWYAYQLLNFGHGHTERLGSITKRTYSKYYWSCIYVYYRGVWWCHDVVS